MGKLLILISALAIVACSNDKNDKPPCKAQAAFDLSLRTADGPLPDDTRIQVDYHAGVEIFQLNEDHSAQEAVLCDLPADQVDGGDSGGIQSIEQLHCKLWTNGGATLVVSASGYPAIERELKAEQTDDCIETVSITVVLGETDAGS